MGEKMYYVLRIISEQKEPITAKEILVALEKYQIIIDIKTVYSMVKRLNDFYFCLTNKQLIKTIRRRGYLIDEDFFDDGQLQLLVDNIVYNPSLDKVSSKQLLNQILCLSSINQKERLQISENKNELNYDLLLNLTTLIKAINIQHNISFKYISYDIIDNHLIEVNHTNGNLTSETYLVSPYKLILKGAHYYLVGYFNARKNSLSVYRVDRMRLIRNHSSHFEDIQEQFDMDSEFDNSVNMYVSKTRSDLKLVFEPSVLREVVSQFGKDIIVSKLYDGRIEALIKDVALSDGLIGWLMMLQNKIQVSLPLSLRELVKEKLKEMLRLYEAEGF